MLQLDEQYESDNNDNEDDDHSDLDKEEHWRPSSSSQAKPKRNQLKQKHKKKPVVTFPLNSMLSKRSQRGAKLQAVQRLTKQADHSDNDTADGTMDDDTTITTEDARQQSTATPTATPRMTTPGIDHTKKGVV